MALSSSNRITPEAAIGIFAAASIAIIAVRWSARVGKGRGWGEDRIRTVSNCIGIAAFLITFGIAYVAQDEIADLLGYIGALLG